MSSTNGDEEKESDETFQCKEEEEVSDEEDCGLKEDEEDLEAAVKAIKHRVEVAAGPGPDAASVTHQPETVDDFLRNFLLQMDMTETLECFQNEWSEMEQRGLADPELVGPVPDVYTENQRLDREVRDSRREGEELRRAVSTGGETLERVRRERDLQRAQHTRVEQEKNRLVEETRKLKVQCDKYEPAVKRMNEKYRAVLRQTALVTLERDKDLGEADPQIISLCGAAGAEGAVTGTGETSHPVTSKTTSASTPSSQTVRVKKTVKANVVK